jgi:DNA-binding XRE family transcriptional regulator
MHGWRRWAERPPCVTVGKCATVCVMVFARHILEERRLMAGLTRPQLAELAGVAGETVRRIELGRFQPLPATARALADALDIDVLALWCDEVAA